MAGAEDAAAVAAMGLLPAAEATRAAGATAAALPALRLALLPHPQLPPQLQLRRLERCASHPWLPLGGCAMVSCSRQLFSDSVLADCWCLPAAWRAALAAAQRLRRNSTERVHSQACKTGGEFHMHIFIAYIGSHGPERHHPFQHARLHGQQGVGM